MPHNTSLMDKKSSKSVEDRSVERSFGQVLQRLRQERGLSQEGLGFASGYHRTYISQLERGQKNPSLRTIFQLAKALKVRPSEIIEDVQALTVLRSRK